jgi:N-acylneuraminate cytidylyltransferase
MDVLALVPARGGSKAVPRKNIRPLAGKPLIVHTLEHASEAVTVTRTIVSTDDEEIAEIARTAGADVPFLRPPELAQDSSPDLGTFRHALEWLAAREDYVPHLVVHLRPTHPFRDPALVDRAVRAIAATPAADALRSVSTPDQTPYKMWRTRGLYLEPLVTVEGVRDAQSQPRQSLPEVWWQNGYIDVIRPRTVLELDSMTGERILPFVIEDPGIEIDYEDGFRAAEALLGRATTKYERREPRHPA